MEQSNHLSEMHHGGMMTGMQMYFYWSHETTILFDGWKTTNQWEYTLSCLFFFFLAAFYEWLSTYRNNLRRSVKSDYTSIQDESIQPYSTPYPFILTEQSRRSMLRGHHLRLTLLYTFQLAISYIIMLVVMTFNGGLFVSCILGFGVGYFLFGASRPLEAAPSCHVTD